MISMISRSEELLQPRNYWNLADLNIRLNLIRKFLGVTNKLFKAQELLTEIELDDFEKTLSQQLFNNNLNEKLYFDFQKFISMVR